MTCSKDVLGAVGLKILTVLRACLASFMVSLRACLAGFRASLMGCFVGILYATFCLKG